MRLSIANTKPESFFQCLVVNDMDLHYETQPNGSYVKSEVAITTNYGKISKSKQELLDKLLPGLTIEKTGETEKNSPLYKVSRNGKFYITKEKTHSRFDILVYKNNTPTTLIEVKSGISHIVDNDMSTQLMRYTVGHVLEYGILPKVVNGALITCKANILGVRDAVKTKFRAITQPFLDSPEGLATSVERLKLLLANYMTEYERFVKDSGTPISIHKVFFVAENIEDITRETLIKNEY